MKHSELRLLLHGARRALALAMTLLLLTLVWPFFFDQWSQLRRSETNRLEDEKTRLGQEVTALRQDVSDLNRLLPNLDRWRRSGLLAAADRPAWFEILSAQVGANGKVELSTPESLADLEGALRHPLKIELGERLDSEVLAWLLAFDRMAPAPWQLHKLVLDQPGANGLQAAIEGSLLHIDPALVKKADALDTMQSANIEP